MKIIGHRGAKGLAPENTLTSFTKALEHHVDEIELDVRVTKDDVVICIHDPWLHDQAGTKLRVADHTYAELLKHKADLPTLLAALQLVNKAVPVSVEVKPGEALKPVVDVLAGCLNDGWKPTALSLRSKDFPLLQALHKALPNVPTVILESWSGLRASRRANKLGTKQVCMQQLWLWRGFITPVTRRGWQLTAYTLNDPAKARRWAKYGLAGVVTDYPDLYEQQR